MQKSQFRDDLFYRLGVVTVTVPPLRDRVGDIPELARYFLRRYGRELGVAEPSVQAEALKLLK